MTRGASPPVSPPLTRLSPRSHGFTGLYISQRTAPAPAMAKGRLNGRTGERSDNSAARRHDEAWNIGWVGWDRMEWDRDIGYTVSGRLGVICRAGQGRAARTGPGRAKMELSRAQARGVNHV
jgi:hypothetical protein